MVHRPSAEFEGYSPFNPITSWCNSETLSDDEVIVVGETLDDLLAAIARDR